MAKAKTHDFLVRGLPKKQFHDLKRMAAVRNWSINTLVKSYVERMLSVHEKMTNEVTQPETEGKFL